MFEVSKCPVCEELVDVAHEQFVHAIVKGRNCKLVNTIPDGTDVQTIVVLVHEYHADEFKRMVAAGSWTPV